MSAAIWILLAVVTAWGLAAARVPGIVWATALAGSGWWEGELVGGNPNWEDLFSLPLPGLSDAEQAFLDGPVEKLCAMLDDWQITHERGDLPPEGWRYLKEQGFFGM